MEKKEVKCSFCGRDKQDTNVLIAGITGHICDSCITQAQAIIAEELGQRETAELEGSLALQKPADIKAFLDEYIIGQDDAKKVLSVAVYNHYKRLMQPAGHADEVEIEKSNIILVGETGTGKTLLAKTIARMLNVPFAIADATVLTEAGYVGEDVESILSRLLQAADYDVSKAERGIVFIDEIDKVCRRGEYAGADVSREGVQRDLLPLVEGSTVSTKYGPVNTDHVLFIASGAFHLAKPSDLIPELQGRFPIRVELCALGVDDFEKILSEPSNALTRQYEALMGTEGLKLEFRPDGIRRLAEIAAQVNERQENIGARRLHTVLEKLLEPLSFDASERTGEEIVIDAEFVNRHLGELAKNEDLSRYIL